MVRNGRRRRQSGRRTLGRQHHDDDVRHEPDYDDNSRALSSVTVAGNLFDEHIIGHYAAALDEIGEHGLYATLAQASSPYLDAVWHNFDGQRETWTEELVTGRIIGKAWTSVRGWFSSSAADEPAASGDGS